MSGARKEVNHGRQDEIVRKGIELWNAHDRDGFLAVYDDGLVFFDQPFGGADHRPGGVRQGLLRPVWTEAYPDNQLKEVTLFGEGELVCFQARFVGTNTGIFHAAGMEMPPTGKPIDAPFVFIAEVGNGKVTRAWHYYDRLLAFEQEGIVSLETMFAELQAA